MRCNEYSGLEREIKEGIGDYKNLPSGTRGIVSSIYNVGKEYAGKARGLFQSIEDPVKKYLIDTTAKVGFYTPLMASMETINGLEPEQIAKSRACAIAMDVFLARIYTKLADYLEKKFKAKTKLKSWLIDGAAMVATYSTAYAAILAGTGANLRQIATASAMGAAIGLSTSGPFRKYILKPWRNYWEKRKKLNLSETKKQ